MRYLLIALLLVGLSPMHAIAENETSAATTEQKETVFVGYLYDAMGEVEVSLGTQMTQAVSKGYQLQNDTTVSTGEKSSAVLRFNDGQVIALQENTSLKVLDYHYNPDKIEKSNLFFYMLKGGLHAITGSIGHDHPAAFRMETRETTIGVHGTDFKVTLEDKLYLQVTSGSISMDNTAGSVALKTGQTAAVASAKTLPVLLKADELPQGIFSKLEKISVPEPKPILMKESPKPGASPVSAPAQTATEKPLWSTHTELPTKDFDSPAEIQAKRERAEKAANAQKTKQGSCADYGWKPGTPEYDECMTYARLMKVKMNN